jgi:hypothetical protein
MPFDLKGVRLERLVVFCRQVTRIQQTPDLISFVAGETEHVWFCRIISDSDDKFHKRFAAVCKANRIDAVDIRRQMRLVASVLRIDKQVDYYKTLGVSPDADEETIKQAYRKKALILHPDKAAGDTENGEAFIKLQKAYLHLSDSEMLRLYNQPCDGSGYWVEMEKNAKMPARGVGFGLFLSWMLVSICSVIIVAYAFDIYKNGSITFFSEHLIPRWLNKPESISKNQFDKESKAKAIKIVNRKMPYPNNNAVLETELETAIAPRSMTKVDRKKNDVIVASLTKARRSVFPRQNKTKSDGPVAQADKNPSVKKAVCEKTNLRQKKKIKVASPANKSTTKKTIARVINKKTLMAYANKDVFKSNKIKKVNYLYDQKRLIAFLDKYTSAYEQKDLNRFKTFFMQDALEQGKPFEALLPTYQQTFNKVEALRYKIDLQSFTIDNRSKKILIEGVYTASYQLPEKDWGNNSGIIRMELLDSSGGLMVSRLEYEMSIR